MTVTLISARWLLVGLLGLGLWLTPGPTYGQSRELRDAYDRAGTLYGQGRYQEALPFAKEAVRLGEREFDSGHPTFATIINRLAEVYRSQGSYAEAELRYRRALSIREKALGPEHPSVGQTLSGLALTYDALGRYAEAEPLYERTLRIAEKALGPLHPNVAASLNNLALNYTNQGRYAEAEPTLISSSGCDIKECAWARTLSSGSSSGESSWALRCPGKIHRG